MTTSYMNSVKYCKIRPITKFGKITQSKGHFAVQGHSRSPILSTSFRKIVGHPPTTVDVRKLSESLLESLGYHVALFA